MEEHIAKHRSTAIVIAMVGKDFSEGWWNSANKAFDMQTPSAMWDIDYPRVYDYLMNHAFGGSGWKV